MLMSTAVALGAGAGLVGGLANAGLQFAILNYQKGVQEDIFKREDNSIQRRVHDLRKAGLSPVLAAGQGAGTGGVVSTQAPQIDGISEGAQIALNMMKMKTDISATEAQEDLTRKNIEIAGTLLPAQLASIEAGIKQTDAQAYKLYQEGKRAKVEADNTVRTGATGTNFFSQVFKDISGFADKTITDVEKKKIENKVKGGIEGTKFFTPFWTKEGIERTKKQVEEMNRKQGR